MIFESGESWYLRSDGARASIEVIEAHPKTVEKRRKKERKKREKGARKVPFGFARALDGEHNNRKERQ